MLMTCFTDLPPLIKTDYTVLVWALANLALVLQVVSKGEAESVLNTKYHNESIRED